MKNFRDSGSCERDKIEEWGGRHGRLAVHRGTGGFVGVVEGLWLSVLFFLLGRSFCICTYILHLVVGWKC